MLEKIFGVVIVVIGSIYLESKLLNKKINFHSYKIYLCVIIASIFLTINVILPYKTIGILIWIGLLSIINKFIFDCDFRSAIITSLCNQVIFIISESLVLIAVTIILNINQNKDLAEQFFNTIYANALTTLISIFFIRIKLVKKLYNFLYSITGNDNFYKVLTVIVGFIFTSLLLFYFAYYNNTLTLFIAICTILTIIYFIILLRSIYTRNNYLNMYVKYTSSLETLKSYEDIMDKYKVSNHENKNQLLTIRNMIKKKDDDVSKFIDKLVKNEYQDDENLMMETSKIPSGGLRALIYSKLLYMKNNNIEFLLKVDRKIRSIQLIDLDESILLDICKVIGVFLDNAIEETQKTKSGSISIELYILDEKLNISVSNMFEGSIDLDRIDETKYTTKGQGHGYGLTLVKEIITKNPKLENIRMINDDVFIQILRINV